MEEFKIEALKKLTEIVNENRLIVWTTIKTSDIFVGR